ncbi:polysaccharide deacetylase family protein [Occallatibacter riparius]|uniref:Polysaccharide deacetylase family protein n=1 Tax=Occallatibacter riparius TaxID=1002689 RepID=A0A9J7BH88_9BACT|nr:polysaccharide deacetylase family protein [Occallatibacter riparius]UWZ81771.1 polysaccharide deacetylase family protein [Occallatibacter riparius]
MTATGALRISDEARLYGLEELSRRAGLHDHDWQGWRIDANPGSLILRRRDGAGQIVFPASKTELSSGRVVRKSWFREPDAHLGGPVPEFIVPFCSAESKAGESLFVETAPGEFRCTEDLLASAALVLSRYEEIVSTERDEHGRFRSANGVATRDGYLDRPIVDEWGLALEQIIQAMEPGWRAPKRTVRVKVSHDVDLIGIPFRLREPAVQILARRQFGAAIRDLLSGFTGVLPGSLGQVMEICEQVQTRGLKSALYWKASARTAFDSGYDIDDPRVARVMDWARAHAIEMGVHPGYYTFGNPEELAAEVDRCRRAVGEGEMGGRQHYLRWSPDTWLHWEQCGMAYDSSVGFADCVGFRAGTCWPYRPWLWNENRRAKLLEIPLVVMEQSLVSPQYMGLPPEASSEAVRGLLRRCASVGGVFTLLWHNNCLGDPYSKHLPGIFDALAGLENHDWRNEQG